MLPQKPRTQTVFNLYAELKTPYVFDLCIFHCSECIVASTTIADLAHNFSVFMAALPQRFLRASISLVRSTENKAQIFQILFYI